MRPIILSLALILGGCSAFHEKPLPPSEATDVRLQVSWVDSVADIPKTTSTDVNGTAVYFDVDGQRYCTIYMVKPYNLNDFKGLQTLAHEVLHCTDGRFHNPAYSNFGAAESRMERLQ
jgi:hypothetical protein